MIPRTRPARRSAWRPLAGPWTRSRLDQIDGRHDVVLVLALIGVDARGGLQGCKNPVLAAVAALIAAWVLKNKEGAWATLWPQSPPGLTQMGRGWSLG